MGISSARGGEVLGEHTVYFLGQGERLELTHRTASRATFARGGLRALEKLSGLPPRLYSLHDILNTY
jgi:4-hydroxy-tetrahydrodipicolinate reductase